RTKKVTGPALGVALGGYFQDSRVRPRRLARPRTSPFHGGNTGSNPVGDAILSSTYGNPSCPRGTRYGTVLLPSHQSQYLPVGNLLLAPTTSSRTPIVILMEL